MTSSISESEADQPLLRKHQEAKGPHSGESPPFLRVSSRKTSAWVWVAHLFSIFICSLMLFISVMLTFSLASSSPQCRPSSDAYTPYTAATGRDFSATPRNVTYKPTKWTAEPSAEVDEAWYDLWRNYGASLRLSADDLRGLGRDPTLYARWPEQYGGGYIGKLEMIHQLHCLDKVRKATRQDHYGPTVQLHIDHCIDYLRMSLMCFSDTTVKPYIWVEGEMRPLPVKTITAQCRNWEDLRDWVKSIVAPNGAYTHLSPQDSEYIFPADTDFVGETPTFL